MTKLKVWKAMISFNGGILTQEITGVQRYASEMMTEIIKLARQNDSPIGQFRIIGVGRVDDSFVSEPAIPISTPKLSRPLWAQIILPFFAKGSLLSLGNIGPIAYRNQILCVHDINTFLVPESYTFAYRLYYKIMLPLLAKRVKHLVTVSDFSREMLKKYGVSGDRVVHVIPNGHEHVFRWDQQKSVLAGNRSLDRPFVFMIGSRARHKNTQIVEAIASELDLIGVNLVIAGRSGAHFQNLQHEERRNVIMLGPVSDDDLAFLYSRAICLAFPSTTEGFGLPALEAMALGCPVVAANVASMPEVCGDAALYADPSDRLSWLKQFRKLIEHEDLRQRLVQAGLVQSEKFSWALGAQNYVKLATVP